MISVFIDPKEVTTALQGKELPDTLIPIVEVTSPMGEGEKQKGPYWKVIMRIVDNEDESLNGEPLFETFAVPRAAIIAKGGAERTQEIKRSFKLFAFLDAAGFSWGANGFSKDDLIGLRARCTLKNEEYEGQSRSRIDKYLKV